MCFGLENATAAKYAHYQYGEAKGDGICIVPVAPHALYQVNEFVINLTLRKNEGENTLGLAQQIAGRIIGTLGYAAVIVAAIVECLVLLALSTLALLPASFLCKNGFVDVAAVGIVATLMLLDIPVRCLSGFVQNILFFREKDFEGLDIFAACRGNSSKADDATQVHGVSKL